MLYLLLVEMTAHCAAASMFLSGRITNPVDDFFRTNRLSLHCLGISRKPARICILPACYFEEGSTLSETFQNVCDRHTNREITVLQLYKVGLHSSKALWDDHEVTDCYDLCVAVMFWQCWPKWKIRWKYLTL